MENLKEGREEVSYSKALGCELFYTILMSDVRNDPMFETLVTYMQYL